MSISNDEMDALYADFKKRQLKEELIKKTAIKEIMAKPTSFPEVLSIHRP